MNAERLERLKEMLDSGKYIVNKETGEVYSPYLGRNMRSSHDGNGYLKVILSCHGKGHQYHIHELVAYSNGMDLLDMTVNHIDGDKTNNHPSNLESLTREQNISKRHLLVRTGGLNNPLNNKRIRAIECCYANGFTCNELSEIFNVPQESVHNIVNRLSKTG